MINLAPLSAEWREAVRANYRAVIAAAIKAGPGDELVERLEEAQRLGFELTSILSGNPAAASYRLEKLATRLGQLADEFQAAADDESARHGGVALFLAAKETANLAFYVLCPETADGNKPTHSPDFRSVRWFGTGYIFTANQAACVKTLWEAWENGTPDVGGESLIEAADASTQRIDVIFRGAAAWGTMIVQGGTKGSYRLAEPKNGEAPKQRKANRKKTSLRPRK